MWLPFPSLPAQLHWLTQAQGKPNPRSPDQQDQLVGNRSVARSGSVQGLMHDGVRICFPSLSFLPFAVFLCLFALAILQPTAQANVFEVRTQAQGDVIPRRYFMV